MARLQSTEVRWRACLSPLARADRHGGVRGRRGHASTHIRVVAEEGGCEARQQVGHGDRVQGEAHGTAGNGKEQEQEVAWSSGARNMRRPDGEVHAIDY
jgi:hypothetical protein